MSDTTKHIELPALDLQLDLVLLIPIEYLLTHTVDFESYLQSSWPVLITDRFWQIYNRLRQNVHSNRPSESRSDATSQVLSTDDLYYLYVIFLVYLKERDDIDFIYYLQSKWPESFQQSTWEIYYHLVDSIYNWHSMLAQPIKNTHLDTHHHYHVLLLIMDYLMTGGDPTAKSEGNQEFINYMFDQYNATTYNAFIKTHSSLLQVLHDYHLRYHPLSADEQTMNFIQSIVV